MRSLDSQSNCHIEVQVAGIHRYSDLIWHSAPHMTQSGTARRTEEETHEATEMADQGRRSNEPDVAVSSDGQNRSRQ